jgi:hypothetical protein
MPRNASTSGRTRCAPPPDSRRREGEQRGAGESCLLDRRRGIFFEVAQQPAGGNSRVPARILPATSMVSSSAGANCPGFLARVTEGWQMPHTCATVGRPSGEQGECVAARERPGK